MIQGIYTLANDPVYDQLVALLNSIEVNISPKIPICIIPYDNRLEKVKKEVASRKNVILFDNQEALNNWDDFINEVWEAHPQAKKGRLARPPWYKGFVHRKFASFNGNFEKFIFFDADSLAMKPVEDVFKKLDNYDFIFNDWEHSKPKEATEVDLDLIKKSTKESEKKIRNKIHCDSFFGSRKEIFNPEKLKFLKFKLIGEKEINWVKQKSWWSSSALFNCLTFHGDYSMFNFTRSHDSKERTGNCADADPFVNINNVLYNEQGLKPIHRIHYMNYPSAGFTRLCQGEDANIRYQDIFLHYRFLKNPELLPQQLTKPTLINKANRKAKHLSNKMKRIIS